jgi:DNA invertase Pin-like site-specific DNA recombinase
VFGYARVSSVEQARGSSLRDQQASIAAHAKSLGLSVTKFYVEAESAVREKIEHREQLQALVREVKRGDLVVVDKLDRWSRDAEFSYRSVREILERGASMYFVAERIDPATTDGDSALSFRILFAREEHKRIRERMVGTRKILRDQGYYVEGLPPLGYKRAHPKGYKGVEKNVLVVDDANAAIVRRAFMLCAGGKSLSQIAERLEIGRDQVHDVLKSRIYLGESKDSAGTWIKARWPAIIDEALFVRANDALSKRKHRHGPAAGPGAETDSWILRDVAVCGRCGAKMSAAYAGPLDARRYYYRCSAKCTTRYVPVRLVELAAEPLVLERLHELRNDLSRVPEREASPRPVPNDERRKKLERRRARLLEMYADGLMEREPMLSAVGKVDADILRLRAADREPDVLADRAQRRGVLQDVAGLEKAWRQSGPARRRAIVTRLAVRIALSADEPPSPTWRTLEELAGSEG